LTVFFSKNIKKVKFTFLSNLRTSATTQIPKAAQKECLVKERMV
jgi:hypothetical protein